MSRMVFDHFSWSDRADQRKFHFDEVLAAMPRWSDYPEPRVTIGI